MQTSAGSSFLRAESELARDEARKLKAEKTKTLGDPISLPGKPLDVVVRGSDAWLAEGSATARLINLETGKTRRIFKGHGGPVTSLVLHDDDKILITGAWDKIIRIWDAQTKDLISATPAHSDFVKTLFVIPALNLLVSGSSDKTVRLWDLSDIRSGKPLVSAGSISAHTRPVERLEGQALPDGTGVLYTADTMGIIRVWALSKEEAVTPARWQATQKAEYGHHRTGINDMVHGAEQLWTASSDETVQAQHVGANNSAKTIPPITHPVAVKAILHLGLTDLEEPYLITGAGDVIRVYDISSPDEPELLNEIDAHWHDVTALRLWLRKTVGEDGVSRVEPWVISASLDGTLRKWRVSEMIKPTPPPVAAKSEEATEPKSSGLTEEEERELEELMAED
ncbi:WD40 repeat-like protein [Heliocybe sulcata]|uniref:WD40 repeat-like protein n=1 Tax=Heliocybe sulcata TaxID=5364 RepID=A0A5C3NC11_9AGAM|nr:WD40 repeat-like protein [Heliocybe sulcata]